MATLYVENVPEDLYEALRRQAREHRRSIAAETLALLAENVPTARELKARQEFVRQAQRARSQRSAAPGPFPSSEELQREDRCR
jgi:plasmid stability protein